MAVFIFLSAAARVGVTPTGAAATRPRRLLVIDDEPAIRTAIRRFFTRRSWEVDEAIDGRAGLEILLAAGAESRYALVICDLRMPGITGVELHDYLAEHRPPLLERLVFSTGDVASSDAAQFVERTRCRVLQKPFELANLARVAAEMADRGEG